VLSATCAAEESIPITEIQVSDTVKVEDCKPFGTQCKMGSQYLKKPVVLNFEGLLHRVIIKGEIFPEGLLSAGRKPSEPDVRKWYVGADVTILSGVAKGQKRKIKAIETRKGLGYVWGKGEKPGDRDFFVFDKPVGLWGQIRMP